VLTRALSKLTRSFGNRKSSLHKDSHDLHIKPLARRQGFSSQPAMKASFKASQPPKIKYLYKDPRKNSQNVLQEPSIGNRDSALGPFTGKNSQKLMGSVWICMDVSRNSPEEALKQTQSPSKFPFAPHLHHKDPL